MTILTDRDKPINTLTVAELESLIAEIVRRVLDETLEKRAAPNGDPLPEAFLDTFGAWDDERPSDEIVDDIYESRTVQPQM